MGFRKDNFSQQDTNKSELDSCLMAPGKSENNEEVETIYRSGQ